MNSILQQKDGIPLYLKLKAILEEQIEETLRTGGHSADKKMPTETELCEQYGVSRITVRQALNLLESEGKIVKRQGKGTFISITTQKIRQNLSSMYSFSTELEKMGVRQTVKVETCRRALADQETAAALGIEYQSDVCHLKRLRFADGIPYATENSYIPCTVINELKAEDIEQNGLYNTLKAKVGVFPDAAEEEFQAVIPDDEIYRQLRMDKRHAAMLLRRTAYFKGSPVEFCVCYLSGNIFSYKVELH